MPLRDAAERPSPPASSLDQCWKYAFAGVAAFALVALWDIPEAIRLLYLTGGALLVGLFAVCGFVVHARRNPLVLALGAFVVLYWLFAFPPVVNGMDDNSAYLIFARDFYSSLTQSLQPLSERRLFSVGGLYAFQAPILHWLGTQGLSLVEPGLGLLLFVTIIAARGRDTPLPILILLIAFAGAAPLGGQLVAANSSSVFTLAAFNLAILELVRGMMRSGQAGQADMLLLVLIALAAALFRPTAAPFHILLIAAAVAVIRGPSIRRLLLACALLAPAAFLALSPYAAVFGTWLYPLLGKGLHISAGGRAIQDALPIAGHLRNIGWFIANPMFLGVSALALLAFRGTDCRGLRSFAALSWAAFLVFAVAIIVSTSGVASTRYIFPLFMALAASLALSIDPRIFVRRSRPFGPGETRLAHMLALAAVIFLASVWLIAGERVRHNRLGYHYQPSERARHDAALRQAITTSPGNVLIVYIADERFLLEPIRSGYFIMDLPGMIFPAADRSLSYEAALRDFIGRNDIATILYPADTCDFTRRDIYGDSVWHRLLSDAAIVNARALCRIAEGKAVERIGNILVLRLRRRAASFGQLPRSVHQPAGPVMVDEEVAP